MAFPAHLILLLLLGTLLLLLTLPTLTSASYLYPTRPDPKESFTELVTSFGHQLEEHHLMTKDDRVFTVHRVVPKIPTPQFRIPIVILNGILSHSSVYYLDTEYLQANGSFCGANLGFCLSLTGRYDLWILNSDDPLDLANSENSIRFFEARSPDKFWVSSLLSFSKPDVAAFITLIQSVTGSKHVAFIGYTVAADSLFGFVSILPKFENLLKPFFAAAGSQYIGRSTSEFVTVAPLFSKIPRLYIPADVMATYLGTPEETPGRGSKVCAVLIVEPLVQEARDSRFDYGDTNWHLKEDEEGKKEVNFHMVLLYGDQDWTTLMAKLEHLIDMLKNAGDYLIEHGCFKTRDGGSVRAI